MALCEQCGSISIVLARREPADRLLGLFSAIRPFVCRRCGWRGRRDWTDDDLLKLKTYGAGGAERDPGLAVLDGGPVGAKPRESGSEAFDLGQLDLTKASSSQPVGAPSTPRRRSRRRRKSRRREIVATIAVTALLLFLILMR